MGREVRTLKTGDYVVFDPTGRDMLDCAIVGRVVATGATGDDGAPTVIVRPNDGGERWNVSRIMTVLDRP